MIAFLTGRVAGKAPGMCLIDVGGVGYRLAMSTSSLAQLPPDGATATVHTHLHVREDELSLFGFADLAEKDAFEHLITVSGVGPKVALSALSALSSDVLATAVDTDDVALISTIPGVGKKTAQRIILELKGKLAGGVGASCSDDSGTAGSRAASTEARDALAGMGFSAAEIATAVKGAPESDAQAVLRYALKRLGGGA